MSKEEFIERSSALWDKLEKTRGQSKDFFNYEKAFDEVWVEHGRQTLEGSLGSKETKDRRKKTNS